MPHHTVTRTLPSFTGAWVAGASDVNQWIQVDFDEPTAVSGVVTQGRQDAAEWVTLYKLQHYAPAPANAWTTISRNGNDAIFEGNYDQSSKIYNALPGNMVAMRMRLLPVSWHGGIALRWQMYGCYTKGKHFQLVRIPPLHGSSCA